MEKVFLVYKTDVWHSYQSRDTIGIATSLAQAHLICHAQAKKENKKIKGDALFELQNYKQTQSYTGDGEFHIEEVEVNKLL